MSDRIKELLDQISLPRRKLLPAALLGAGSLGALVKRAKADTAFTSFNFNDSISGGSFPPGPPIVNAQTARTDPDRWSDVINVLSFGADPTGANDSTTAIQNAVNALHSGTNGQRGKIYIPPGTFKISFPGVQLPQNTGLTTQTPSIIIEGAGGSNVGSVSSVTSGLVANPPFNGFILDDLNTSASPTHTGGGPWAVRDLVLKNNYIPPQIYKSNVICSGAWNRGAGTITVTNASGGNLILPGAILMDNSTFNAGGVSGYLGFVAAGGVAVGGSTTVLTLGDGIAPSIGLAGAQIPSGTSLAPGTKTNDTLFVIQGAFANGAFGSIVVSSGTYNSGTGAVSLTLAKTANIQVGQQVTATLSGTGAVASLNGTVTATAGTTGTTLNFTATTGLTLTITGGTINTLAGVTMSASNPGLDAGLYYVLNWTAVTAGKNIMPTCIGVVDAVNNWVGTSLKLNNPVVNGNSVDVADLLVLTPISGAIRHTNTLDAVIENCTLAGFIGGQFECTGLNPVDIGDASQITIGVTVRNCTCANALGSASVVGSIGLYLGQSGLAENCDVSAMWNGIRMQGANPMVIGGRTETCAYGIVLGGLLNAPASSGGASSALICMTEAEGSWIANIATDITAVGNGIIYGVGSSNQHENACYGFYFRALTNLTVISCNVSSTNDSPAVGLYGGYINPSFKGSGTPSGIYIAGSPEPGQSTFIGVTSLTHVGAFWVSEAAAGRLTTSPLAQAWQMPSSSTTVEFISCNNPPAIYTFANLPVARTVTGQISIDATGAGGNGNLLQFTAGASFSPSMQVGSLLTVAGVAIGINIGRPVNGISQITTVSGAAQTVAPGTSITYYPMIDGDEYVISDSPTPYLNTVWSAAVTYAIGNVVLASDGVLYTSRTNGNINHNPAGNADPTDWTQGLYVGGVSNVGKPITVGGGTNHVKVRWDASQQSWILV